MSSTWRVMPLMRRKEGVRMQKATNKGTHSLESADGQISQDTERICLSKGHLPTGEQIWMNRSGYEKNLTE
jgi:hypothetical protein